MHLGDNITPREGRGNTFITFLKERRERGLRMLETPEKIRDLQRKLYHKAKQDKTFRFYLLYDKIYRADILEHAFHLVRANKGAPGIDGVTFESLEKEEGGIEGYLEKTARELKEKIYKPQPVRRVYIPKPDGSKRPLGIPTIKDRTIQMAAKLVLEPIFEADFQDNSYGFRPKKSAHQAIEDISLHLNRGMTKVIDADLSKYFDTIPHDKLLILVAKRIVDKNVLHLIKMWLNAPIVEEDEDGTKRYRSNKKGTPQGGVLSPLLANIYLNVLDTLWKAKKIQEEYGARLVRYADDFVVLCKGSTEPFMKVIKGVIGRLGLTLNENKTRTLNAKEEEFTFLGFTIKVVKSPRTGNFFPLERPSKKSLKHIKDEIRRITARRNAAIPTADIVAMLNSKVRGWTNYFYHGHCSKDFSKLRYFLDERMRAYLKRKHKKKNRGYRQFSYSYIHDRLGLFKIPTTAPRCS